MKSRKDIRSHAWFSAQIFPQLLKFMFQQFTLVHHFAPRIVLATFEVAHKLARVALSQFQAVVW